MRCEILIIWLGVLALISCLAAIEQPVFCVLWIFILLILLLSPLLINAIDKILDYCKKSRACDEETHPTNARAEDEGTCPINNSLDPTVQCTCSPNVQGSKKEDDHRSMKTSKGWMPYSYQSIMSAARKTQSCTNLNLKLNHKL